MISLRFQDEFNYKLVSNILDTTIIFLLSDSTDLLALSSQHPLSGEEGGLHTFCQVNNRNKYGTEGAYIYQPPH